MPLVINQFSRMDVVESILKEKFLPEANFSMLNQFIYIPF
jgi:hypothetical protein